MAVPSEIPAVDAWDRSTVPAAERNDAPPDPLALAVDLCASLRTAGVRYCHWKSNNALDRSLSGENDLDLLVDHRSLPTFLDVLAACGFKQARPQRRRRIPGVLHFYGLDEPTGRFVHVDAQALLILGDDTTKNVLLPIEEAYLASCDRSELVPVPAAEFELAVLVVRLALKHGTWDAAAFGLGGLRAAERRELEHLGRLADPARLRAVVETQLPGVGWAAWSRYRTALLDGAPLHERLRAGRRVVAGVADCMRRPPARDTAVRCGRRISWGVRHFVLGQRNTKRLADGGRVVAVVGGDGAGKSTLVRGLAGWLQGPLDTRVVHMGKPPRGPSTVLVKGAVLAARRTGLIRHWLPNYPSPAERGDVPPSYAWLLWQLTTARDRRRQHRQVRALAERGFVVVCDRFPLDQITLMDGSRTQWVPRGLLTPGRRLLVDAEQRCYADITPPDALLVLRVDPDTAVARKIGVDPAEFVRPRSAELFGVDWRDTSAVVLDASQPADDVLAAARRAAWAAL